MPIHLYSLYSHPNPDFSQKWASRDEVLAYWVQERLATWDEMRKLLTRLGVYAGAQKRIAAQHRLHDKFVFRSEFVSSHWDNTTQQHTVEFRNTQTKETFSVVADVLISATGALNLPKIPSVPGRETFKGLQWHSSQWRDDVDLRGNKVAVVGNGSSGIQIIPNIVEIEGLELINLSVFLAVLAPPSVPVLIFKFGAVSARRASSARRRTSITAASPNPFSAMSPSRSDSIAGRRSRSSKFFSSLADGKCVLTCTSALAIGDLSSRAPAKKVVNSASSALRYADISARTRAVLICTSSCDRNLSST